MLYFHFIAGAYESNTFMISIYVTFMDTDLGMPFAITSQ